MPPSRRVSRAAFCRKFTIRFMSLKKKLNLIGSTILDMRKKRSWSQEYLAKKLRSLGWNVSRTTLAQIEAAHKRITDCDLLFLAAALKANLSDCFPADAAPAILPDKIRSKRPMVNGAPNGTRGKIPRNGQIPPPRFLSMFQRLNLWKPHRI